MPEGNAGQTIQVVDKAQAPLWKGDQKHHTEAAFRGKTNVAYTDTRADYPGLFSKTATQVEGRKINDVEKLQHEFDLLTKLADSGVTPEPKGMTISPDGKEGHLLMEQVKGVSLDKTEPTPEEQKQFDDIVSQTSAAVETVNNNGVLIVDISKGTFLINGLGDQQASISTKVVDLELGEEINQLGSQKTQDRVSDWYSRNDYGFLIAQYQENFMVTEDIARKAEQHLAAKAITEHFLGYSNTWDIDIEHLTPNDRRLYYQQLQSVRPALEASTVEQLRAEHQRFREKGYDDIPENEESYINNELNYRMQYKISEVMINITLPYLLQNKGITASPETVRYLQQTLSPNLQDRSGYGLSKKTMIDYAEANTEPTQILTKLAKSAKNNNSDEHPIEDVRQDTSEQLQKQPIDFTLITNNGEARYIAVGEMNHVDTSLIQLGEHFKTLRDLGYTDFAIEALDSDMQSRLDNYDPQNLEQREEIIKYIEENFGGKPEIYMSLIDKAIASGMHIVCLDMPLAEQDAILTRSDGSHAEWIEERDEHMARIVTEILQDPSRKMVALSGAGHAGKLDSSIIRELRVHGDPTISIIWEGGSGEAADYMRTSPYENYDWEIRTVEGVKPPETGKNFSSFLS